jgi:hypothetical protein
MELHDLTEDVKLFLGLYLDAAVGHSPGEVSSERVEADRTNSVLRICSC